MFKKLMILISVVGILMMLSSCGEKKILHCDKCGKEVSVAESSNMEEEWILFCPECGDIETE